jgi:hypothetical protein
MFILKEAIDRAKGTDPDKLVEELEKTDYVGTVGRVQFRGKDDIYPHDPKYGPEYVVAKWVLWTTLAKDPLKANPQKDPLRVVIWPKQYRLRPDEEGKPISIDECINKARRSIALRPRSGRRRASPRADASTPGRRSRAASPNALWDNDQTSSGLYAFAGQWPAKMYGPGEAWPPKAARRAVQAKPGPLPASGRGQGG